MTASFETYRRYLFAIDCRMLGSTMDAEDMVQETYLRYQATLPETIASPKAFLTTVITRLCMDQLHLARRKREQYLGPWLPEPLITAETPELEQVEERVDAYETISLTFLILLEQLQPAERAVFLLREVFEYAYTEIAAVLDTSELACRQWFSKAKKHLADHRPRFPASPDTQKPLLTGFLQAAQAGEMTTLMNLLAEDVTFWADGGGKVPSAATHSITGRVAVAHIFLSPGGIFSRSVPDGVHVEMTEVNRQPALVMWAGGRAFAVLTIEVEALGLIALFTFGVTWMGVVFGLIGQTPAGSNSLSLIFLLLVFTSSAFVNTDSMPAGVRWFAQQQPVTPIIDTLCGLLLGTPNGNSVGLAIGWCVGLILVGFL